MVVPSMLRNDQIKDFKDAYDTASTLFTLYDRFTNLPTRMDSFDDLGTFVSEAQFAGNEKKSYDAINARLITKVVGKAVPLAHQIWIVSEKFVKTAIEFMNTEVGNKLDGFYAKYSAEKADMKDSHESVDVYIKLLEKFRNLDIFFYNGEPIPGMETLTGSVAAVLQMREDQLIIAKEMLDDMIEKRKRRIEAAGGTVNQRREKKIPTHVAEYLSVLANVDKDLATITHVDIHKKNKEGNYLMATAVAHAVQNGSNKTDLFSRLDLAFVNNTLRGAVKANAERLIAESDAQKLQWQTSSIVSQQSNIDPIFLTFFIAARKCSLSVENFYDWQRVLNAAGARVRGREQLSAFLTSYAQQPGIQLLLGSMSANTDINLPPFIINFTRMQDIFSCVGCFDTRRKEPSLTPNSVSWRYMACIDKPYVLDIIITSYTIEKLGYENSNYTGDKIYQSEHQLHQILLRKDSPYQCSNFISGNALNVFVTTIDRNSIPMTVSTDPELTFWKEFLVSGGAKAAEKEIEKMKEKANLKREQLTAVGDSRNVVYKTTYRNKQAKKKTA